MQHLKYATAPLRATPTFFYSNNKIPVQPGLRPRHAFTSLLCTLQCNTSSMQHLNLRSTLHPSIQHLKYLQFIYPFSTYVVSSSTTLHTLHSLTLHNGEDGKPKPSTKKRKRVESKKTSKDKHYLQDLN
mmetsp:Transcript_15421/g.33170  ORF Transcript_15421/g.33170 Transcript_15421/m.33170 type:complete len:129 (+) Transcript_15421:1940-2326(+)